MDEIFPPVRLVEVVISRPHGDLGVISLGNKIKESEEIGGGFHVFLFSLHPKFERDESEMSAILTRDHILVAKKNRRI